jgi:hypothetical protein
MALSYQVTIWIINVYLNLSFGFSTVCSDPFYGQTSGPRPTKYLQAVSKSDTEGFSLPNFFFPNFFQFSSFRGNAEAGAFKNVLNIFKYF